MPKFTVFLTVVGLQERRGEWANVQDLCWSVNTHKARRSQWRRYDRFCMDYGLIPLPASTETVCLYITYLARSCCYVTIKNYISGLWALHDYWGTPHVDPSVFLIKSTMTGAKRLLGCETVQAEPLSPQDMIKLYKCLDISNPKDLQLWCALTVAYRCLLRVSHITTSPHTIKAGDVRFTSSGMDISIRSSKTIQFRERVQTIPVVRAGVSPLCPTNCLPGYIRLFNLSPSDQLFPYTYNQFAALFKRLCTKAKLVGKYSTHSMRRGSATFLSSFLPLHDVKSYGDGKSWSVLLYISDSYHARRTKDQLVAQRLSHF